MTPEDHYRLSTLGYIACAVVGLIGVVFFAIKVNVLLVLLSALFVGVALDNVFCGARARSYGIPAKKHYILPQFLKR